MSGKAREGGIAGARKHIFCIQIYSSAVLDNTFRLDFCITTASTASAGTNILPDPRHFQKTARGGKALPRETALGAFLTSDAFLTAFR